MAPSHCWTPATSPPGRYGSSASSPGTDRLWPAAHCGRGSVIKVRRRHIPCGGVPASFFGQRNLSIADLSVAPWEAVRPGPLLLRGELDDLSFEHQVRIGNGIQVGVGKVLPAALDPQLLGNDAQGV